LRKPSKVEVEGQLTPTEEPALEEGGSVGSVVLQEIRSQGRIFHLIQPLIIAVSRFGGGWCYESKPFAILAFGASKHDALDSFTEDFLVLWDAIAQAPEESLTEDAIPVKHAFQQLVRAITSE